MARPIAPKDLLALVDRLSNGTWQSGETLAEEAGISRAGLAKRMAHLRNWGLELETQKGRGYRLSRPVERLDASLIASGAPAGLRVSVEPLIDSTNRVLIEADAVDDPCALLAEHQSGGKGRRGRQWQSPFAANIYLSMSWTYPLWPAQLSSLSLAVGVVCARCLRTLGLEGIRLKWPNDIWLDQKKLGGILIEQRGESGGVCRLVVGIGLNVSMQASQAAEIDQAWTTVNAEMRTQGRAELSRNEIASALIAQLYDCLLNYSETGFQPYRDDWSTLDALRDQAVRVPDDPSLSGIGRGIDDDGAFLIETRERLKRVHAGEVSLRVA